MITTNLTLTNGVTSVIPVQVTGITFEAGTKLAVNPATTFPFTVAIDSSVVVGIDFDETINTGDYTESLTVNTLGGNHDIVHAVTIDDTTPSTATTIVSLNGDLTTVGGTRYLVDSGTDATDIVSTTGGSTKFNASHDMRIDILDGAIGDIGWITMNVRDTNTTTTSYLMSQVSGNRLYIKLDTSELGLGIADSSNILTGVSVVDDIPYIITVQWNTGAYDVYIGTVLEHSGTYTGIVDSTGTSIGGGSAYSSYCNASIATVIKGEGVLLPHDIDLINNNPELFFNHCNQLSTIEDSSSNINKADVVANVDLSSTGATKYNYVGTGSPEEAVVTNWDETCDTQGLDTGFQRIGIDSAPYNSILDMAQAPPAEDDNDANSIADGTTGVVYYYSVDGDDLNDGLSEGSPKKTYTDAGSQAISMDDGDVIAFKRGDVWDETVEYVGRWADSANGSIGNPKIITCYGTGARPIIDGLVTQATTGWTDEGGGIWSIVPSVNPTIFIRTLVLNDAKVLGTDIEVDFTSFTEFIWFHDVTLGVVKIKVDPTANKIQWSDADSSLIGYSGSPEYLEFSYIETKYTRDSAIRITGHGATGNKIHHCTVGEGSKYGINVQGFGNIVTQNIVDSKQPLFDYSMTSNTDNCGGYEGVRNYADANGDNNEFSYNTVRNFNHANFNMVGDDIVSYTNLSLHHNLSDGRGLLYGGSISLQKAIDGAEVYNNVQNGGRQCQTNCINSHIHHNIYMNIKMSTPLPGTLNDGMGIICGGLGNFDSNTVEYNLFYNLDGVGVYLPSTDTYTKAGNIIRGNIMVDTCKLPMMYSGSHTDIAIYLRTGHTYEATDTVIDANIMYSYNNNPDVIFVGTEAQTDEDAYRYTVAEAEVAPLGSNNVFTNNQNLDPLFADKASGNFKVLVGSPAIDITTIALSTIDADDAPMTSPYNAGIYDSVATASTGSMYFDAVQANQQVIAVPLTAHSALEIIGGVNHLYTNDMVGGLHYYIGAVEQAVPTEIIGFFNMNNVSEISGLAVSARELFEVYDGIKEAV